MVDTWVSNQHVILTHTGQVPPVMPNDVGAIFVLLLFAFGVFLGPISMVGYLYGGSLDINC